MAVSSRAQRRHFHNNARNGASRQTPIASFTARSPAAQLTHGKVEPANAIDQKMVVSTVALQVVATIGARHQLPRRRRSNTVMSSSWATMKAEHEAMAMRGVATRSTAAPPPRSRSTPPGAPDPGRSGG